MKGYYVYILRCADNSLYTGWSNDIHARLKKHERGLASKYTRSRLPLTLVYVESLSSRSEAQIRENAIKKMRRPEKEALIVNSQIRPGIFMNAHSEIIRFWFEESTPEQWWKKDPAYDAEISRCFLNIHKQAMAGELFAWRASPLGSLAEIIVLDQFSRNMFRGTAASFASDSLALVLAQNAINNRFDIKLLPQERAFMYMPFMHSESPLIHEYALKLFKKLGNKNNLNYEIQHKKIIDRFGRYPHRNTILNRQSTPEELRFLQEAGSSF